MRLRMVGGKEGMKKQDGGDCLLQLYGIRFLLQLTSEAPH